MTQRRCSLTILFALVAGLSAQRPLQLVPATVEATQLGIGAGLQEEAGTLLGFGTDYKATFADGQLVYTPMLGMAAAHDLPLAMVVTHVGRGELAPVGAATTMRHELRVDFVRPQLREQFDIRPEGLKQGFVFAQLPPGTGDLVVRTQLTTELRPERASSDGALRFTLPGQGGVEIGAVLGIDANGATATGTLRTDGDTLDFVLPADFVAKAALPLVVDPLIGAVVVTSAAGEDREPAVCAQGSPFNSYLVVWARAASATNNDVRAQRVAAAGGLFGGLITIEATATSADSIQVADSQHSSKWCVCWHQGGDIQGRFVDTLGGLTATLAIATGANVQNTPSVGGGNVGGLGSVVCVWRDSTANAIKACRINILTETADPEVTLASGTSLVTLSQPTISPDNPTTRLLVTYVSNSSLLNSPSVRGVVVDDDAVAVTATFPIAGTASTTANNPSCAGDGLRWVVAFTTAGTLGNGASCAPVALHSGQAVVGATRPFAGGNGPVRNTAVAWFGDSATIAFTSTNGSANDVSVLSIDPFTCANCEGTLVIDSAGNDLQVAMCSRFGNLSSVNQGAVVFVPLTAGVGDISLRFLFEADGTTVDLGGGCAPGSLTAPCAHAGNQNFGVQMRNGLPNELTFAIYSTGSFGASGFPCGPCFVVPDTTIGVIQTAGVSSPFGEIGSPLPLPGGAGVIGVDVFAQFFYFGSSCLNLFRLTNAIRFTIE